MRICAIIKYPPIQGGVSAQSYWMCRALAEAGHEVHVVTNADEVEEDYRLMLTQEDRTWLEPSFGTGRVQLHGTERMSPIFLHVPQTNPYVGKLAGVATEVVRRHRCEIIFSYYYEPYGVAAHMASSWTGVPYLVRNAGSDLGRLMNRHGLGTTYREIIRRANGVCVGNPLLFLGMGVPPSNLYRGPPPDIIRQRFRPDVEPLDLNGYLNEVARDQPHLLNNRRPIDPSVPVIGIYGKVGVNKGTYDLVKALGQLRKEGQKFHFVSLTRGKRVGPLLKAVEEQGLSEVTWILPFVAHWNVARFIRACRAVCFLERDFPITFHAPTVPREVLGCGTCLVLSGEVAAKQPFHDRLISGQNMLLVPNPQVTEDLAAAVRKALEDPEGAQRMGQKGHELLETIRPRDLAAEYTRLFEDVLARHRGQPGQMSAAERGLPENREEGLRRTVPGLLEALGERAEATLQAYLEAHPKEPAHLFEDASAFCRWIETGGGGTQRDATLAEVARYTGLLVWMGHFTAEDEAQPAFERPDVWEATRGGPSPETLRALAPLRSQWVRVERFHALPPGLLAGAASPGGEATVVFHKRTNLYGHHFRVNPFTSELLDRCNGQQTVGELLEHYRSRGAASSGKVEPAVLQALERFHQEGLIVFVKPAAPRAGA
ncbi:glycosyltransferase [Stigmatella aurantiaca]|uniref:Glycosyl transferase, group 1 family protein n=2 Tax=Stigmatella aurantiaca (strain DW4/3-1) TaxID=378806 RepID=E3FSE3_STIAD|nr:glycosyltransferase [Stigmatella aurantiaca]ADO72054.1 Glycosyl transferase, group 1 family protein [Stigmatella aurantiaca DW4/3-1]